MIWGGFGLLCGWCWIQVGFAGGFLRGRGVGCSCFELAYLLSFVGLGCLAGFWWCPV